jgi:LasA protease
MLVPEKKRLQHLFTLALGLAWLVPALACNFPLSRSAPGGLPASAAQGTLSAELTALAQASQPPPDATGAPLATATSLPEVGTATPAEITPSATPPAPGTVVPGTAMPSAMATSGATFTYTTQPGDTLTGLAGRFGVSAAQIGSDQPLSAAALLPPGLQLTIPNALGVLLTANPLLPDGEVVASPAAAGFDLPAYAAQAGGFFNSYHQQVDGIESSGTEVLQRVSNELSVNPRLLLAFLEFRSRWVLGQPVDPARTAYPLGFNVPDHPGLYNELTFAATKLNIAYYGWRQGTLSTLTFSNGRQARLNPVLNAGSAAVQYLFSFFYDPADWEQALYGPQGFLALYQQMFGDPWVRAAASGPVLPPDLAQPDLELPFPPGEPWAFTGGPHQSWNTGTPAGALDFSPANGQPPCVPSTAWVTASADGLVVRADHNVVALDLDGDGYEGTGWVVIYLHVATRDMIAAGTPVKTGERLGHPSCEQGRATGTHVHIARKYNGEWVAAAGPLRFALSGWLVQAGVRAYEGTLTKGDQVVSANPGGPRSSLISH